MAICALCGLTDMADGSLASRWFVQKNRSATGYACRCGDDGGAPPIRCRASQSFAPAHLLRVLGAAGVKGLSILLHGWKQV